MNYVGIDRDRRLALPYLSMTIIQVFAYAYALLGRLVFRSDRDYRQQPRSVDIALITPLLTCRDRQNAV